MVGHPDHHSDVSGAHRVGDDFDSLLLKFTPLIYKVVGSLGFYQESHDHEGLEADDAFQAGSLGLWFSMMGYDPKKATFVSHAYNCIRWEILDEMRRTGWSGGRTKVAVNYEDFRNFHDSTDVEALVIAEDEIEKIGHMIEKMDASRRTVFQGLMRHQGRDGLFDHKKLDEKCRNITHKQVADALDISKSRVYQYRDDIRKKLRVIH